MTLTRTPRRMIALAVFACLVSTGLIGAQASVAKTKSCPDPPISTYPDKQHGGYFTNFKVTNVTCRSAVKLAIAYYKCRRKKGIKGSCSGRTVNGLKCTENRPDSGDNGTEFNATVTCKKGSKKVKHSYQQNY